MNDEAATVAISSTVVRVDADFSVSDDGVNIENRGQADLSSVRLVFEDDSVLEVGDLRVGEVRVLVTQQQPTRLTATTPLGNTLEKKRAKVDHQTIDGF